MNLDTFIRNLVKEVKKINGNEEVILKGGYKLSKDIEEITDLPAIIGTEFTLTSEAENTDITIDVEILYK